MSSMNSRTAKTVLILTLLTAIASKNAFPQEKIKKIKMAIPSTNVTFLPLFVAKQNGYYKDEGFDVEFILMRALLASTAVLTGDIDYNGAVTGVIGAAVKGQPLKNVIFTMRSPVQSLMASKEIRELQLLKGKKVATSSPGATADLVAKHILKRFGLEPGRDAFIIYAATEAARLVALDSGVVDAAVLSVPENILAHQKGFNELAVAADFIEFPQNGFGTSIKKIQENRDEVYRMVRATLRGLLFALDAKNKDASLDIIMKQWKVGSRKMASEMYDYMAKASAPSASVSMEAIQFFVDTQRQNANVREPVSAGRVYDGSFVEMALKDLSSKR